MAEVLEEIGLYCHRAGKEVDLDQAISLFSARYLKCKKCRGKCKTIKEG